MARRFWYNAYTATIDAVLAEVDEIAADQGSLSPEVVLQNYLSDTRKRSLRRTFMHDKLAIAFDPDRTADGDNTLVD